MGPRERRRDALTRRLKLVFLGQLGLAVSLVGFWLLASQPDWFARADFTSFYAGWSIVRDGRGAALYDLSLQGDYQAPLLGQGRFADGVLPYFNPPHLTLPFVPLSWLPRPAAFFVWAGLQVALLGWLLRWLVRDLAATWSPIERRLLVGAVLTFSPLLFTFVLGAFSLFVLACVAQLYRALVAAQDRRAGAWLVLATVKPQLVLLPLLALLSGRRWRSLLIAVVLGGGLALSATLVLGWPIWLDYLALLRQHATLFDEKGVDPRLMWNVRGTLTVWLGASQASLINAISTLVLVMAMGVTLWLWRGPWRPGTADFDARIALTIVVGLLCAPHVYPHDGLLVVLPAVLGYQVLRRDRQGAYFAAYLLLAGPACLIIEWTLGPRLGLRFPVLVMLGLAIWLALTLARTARRPATVVQTA